MSELEFDSRGNLVPYELIDCNLQTIRRSLAFDSKRRSVLIENFEKYCIDLSEVVREEFSQLIGGSFVSIKFEPNDIDVANLIRLYDPDDEQIESLMVFLTLGGSLEIYQVDGHLIPVYDEQDERYTNTLARIAYFRRWFGQGRDGNLKSILHLRHRV
jgi:hypothetical protein